MTIAKRQAKSLDKMLSLLYNKYRDEPKGTISSSYAYNYTVEQISKAMSIDFKYAFTLMEMLERNKMVFRVEHIHKTKDGDYVIQLGQYGIEFYLYGEGFTNLYWREFKEDAFYWLKISLVGTNAVAVILLTYFTMIATDNSKYYETRDDNQNCTIDSLTSIVVEQKILIDRLTHPIQTDSFE